MHNISSYNKKKQGLIRWGIYAVLGLIIVFFSILLVLAAEGYDIDRSTGEVIQNGLVLVASEPSAEVFINDAPEGDNTPSRLPLRSGDYTLELRRYKYRDWSRTFNVEGSEVLWLNYPRLVPKKIVNEDISTYQNVGFSSRSPDGKILLVQQGKKSLIIDRYNLEAPEDSVEKITIPRSAFTSSKLGTIIVTEWSDNNKTLILRHDYGKKREFVIVDTTKPGEAVNITRALDLTFPKLVFRPGSSNELFILKDGDVRAVVVDRKSLTGSVISNVKDFSPQGDFIISITNGRENKITLTQRNESLDVFTLNAPSTFMETQMYDRDLYIAQYSATEGAVHLFRNPYQQAQQNRAVLPFANFNIDDANRVEFSPGGRFLAVQSRNNMIVYDFEDEDLYQYRIAGAVGDSLFEWIDSFRISLRVGGYQNFFDFDGSNRYRITRSTPEAKLFLDKNSETMWLLDVNGAGKSPLTTSPLLLKD